LYRRSLEQGVDISIQAATKYIGGHSDIMFGLENVEDLKADLARCFAAFNAA
jgi:cystathionine beta-lyase/cystathionine gamma-synthase